MPSGSTSGYGGSGGSSSGSGIGPNSVGGSNGVGGEGAAPAAAALTDTITMRYYSKSEMAPTALKQLLEKFDGVKRVKVDTKTMTVKYSYSGTYPNLVSIERATGRSGVATSLISHARVIVAVKGTKGADQAALLSELGSVEGVKWVCCLNGGTVADLYADVSKLDFEALEEAAGGASYKAAVKSHETVEVTFEEGDGDITKFVDGIFAHKSKKVLIVAQEEGTVTLRCIKSLSDSILKQTARKHKLKVKTIERK